MPLITQLFDDAIRFRLTTAQKRKLYAEAKRRSMSGADLLRELIDTLPGPRKGPKATLAPRLRRVREARQ